MKIDYLSCTKMLFFAETLLRDGDYELPDIDEDFAKRFGMTVQEIKEIVDQFEHDKLLLWDDISTEVEDNKFDNNMTSEISYDALTVDKKNTEELVKNLKGRYALRQTPFISREAVMSIAEQIKQVLKKDEWMRVANTLSIGRNMVDDIKYTLTDLLFRHSYARKAAESLAFVLAEFLNPIYFSLQTKDAAQKLYEYIDVILHTSATKEDYELWTKESAKYIFPKKQDTAPPLALTVRTPYPAITEAIASEARKEAENLKDSIATAMKMVDQQYQSFVGLQEPWSFFQGLTDYVKTIEDMVPTKAIVAALDEQRKVAEQVYQAIDTRAFDELQKAANEITETIKKCAISTEPIQQAVKAVQDQLNGLTWSTDQLHYLDSKLLDVARSLKEAGHPEIIRRFEDENKRIKNIYGNYTFSETFNKVSEEKLKLEKKKQMEPWGAWEGLPLAKKAVLESSDDGDLYAQEMEAIRKGDVSKDDVVFFDTKTYRYDVQRLHRYLMAQLTKLESKQPSSVIEANIVAVPKSKSKAKKEDKKIRQVNFVERKASGGPVYSFYINDDSAALKPLRADSARIRELIKIIRGDNVPFRKDLLDYINSNNDCALYCARKYELTRIIERDGQSFRICVGIKAEVKSEIAHKKRMTHRERA